MAKADWCCEARYNALPNDAGLGVDIQYDPEAHVHGAFVLTVDGMVVATPPIVHCPWCGTELDPEAEPGWESFEATGNLIVIGPGTLNE